MSNLNGIWEREPMLSGGYIETNVGTGAGKIVFPRPYGLDPVEYKFKDRSDLARIPYDGHPNTFMCWRMRLPDGSGHIDIDASGRVMGVSASATMPYTGPVVLSLGYAENGCGGQPGVPVIRCWNCRADYANEAERCADRRVAESIAEDETPPIGGIVDVTHANAD